MGYSRFSSNEHTPTIASHAHNTHEDLCNVVCGNATFKEGSERATPTLVVPTSNPTSRGRILETLE